MPQHVRGDNFGPLRQVHLGGHANGLEQAATSGLAVSPASCVTTTTEPGASHGAELHHPGPRPGGRDRPTDSRRDRLLASLDPCPDRPRLILDTALGFFVYRPEVHDDLGLSAKGGA